MGIKQHPSPADSCLLYLNRAQTYIHLERYFACLCDCNSVLPFLRESFGNLENRKACLEKALFCRASALYSLRRWHAASEAYSELFTLFHKTKYSNNVDRSKQRITESTTLDYRIVWDV